MAHARKAGFGWLNLIANQETFYVTGIEDGRLTVDGNHPLAGKDLQVRIEIKEVHDPTEQERMQDGMVQPTPSGLH